MQLKVNHSNIDFGTNVKDIAVPKQLRRKISTGLGYFDDAMGGEGFTPSVVTLFTGTPGAGKTTMMLKLCDSLTGAGALAVFNTAEESLYQVRMVTERVGCRNGFAIGGENHIPTLLEKCDKLRAQPANKGKDFFLVVDSLQCMDDGKYKDGGINSKTPERVLTQITEYCKEHMVNAIVIGQVNKGGEMAGTQKLKHMIDAHIHLSVEEKDETLLGCRVLETLKNRFGSAGSMFFLRLGEHGFREVGRYTAL
jgi:DNA repair protein RadA/Sms